jgi:phage FluMu protein Com
MKLRCPNCGRYTFEPDEDSYDTVECGICKVPLEESPQETRKEKSKKFKVDDDD